MLGVMPTDEAMRRARDVGMDLVEVSPNERPPVCKIMDYGKHKYLQSKKHKQKHHEQKLKEVRIRPKTDPHDREIKLNRARHFLEQGDKVQFTMMFRGRERFHQDLGNESFQEIITALTDVGKVEQPPRTFGRRMTMLLVPTKVSPLVKPKSSDHEPARAAAGPKPTAGPKQAPKTAPPPETAPGPATDAGGDGAARTQPTAQEGESASAPAS